MYVHEASALFATDFWLLNLISGDAIWRGLEICVDITVLGQTPTNNQVIRERKID